MAAIVFYKTLLCRRVNDKEKCEVSGCVVV